MISHAQIQVARIINEHVGRARQATPNGPHCNALIDTAAIIALGLRASLSQTGDPAKFSDELLAGREFSPSSLAFFQDFQALDALVEYTSHRYFLQLEARLTPAETSNESPGPSGSGRPRHAR